MAFPVVAARATGRSTTTNAVSHAMTLPAGIVAGDLLVVVVACDQNPTISVNTGVSGSGWSQLVQGANGTNVCSNVFWKIATGADALTITLSAADQTSHVSFRITGGYSVTGTSANGSSTNSEPGTHTPPDGAQDYLWIVTRAGDSTVVATAAPTNFSNLQTQAAAGTGGASINTAERAMNGSAYNPTNFTSASEQWVCFTLAVSPVAPAATGAAAGTLGLTGSATGEVTGGGGGGGGTGLTFRYLNGPDSWGTSHSFTGVPIGDADADRWVILALLVAPDSATDVSSVTIGGVSATAHAGNTAGYSPLHVKFYKANVPSGTTADVVISHAGGGAWWSAIGVWTVTGEPLFDAIAQDSTPVDTWPTYVLDVAINIPASGAVVAMGRAPNLSSNPAERSWTGVTEDGYDGSGVDLAVASADGFASGATGWAIALDAAMSPADLVLGVASFSVAGGGGGPSPAVGEATGTLPLSGSGAGQALVGGAGAGSLPLTGTGDGDVRVAGQAAGALPLAGSGTGAAPAEGDGAGSLPLSGAATGAAPAKGDAAGGLPLAGAGAGVAPAVGQASGSLPLSGAGAAAVGETTTGEASGSLPLSGAGAGSARAAGQASGALPLGGEAAGTAPAEGAGAGSLPLTGEAAGLAPVRGQGAGDLPLSGAATGTAEDPESHATGRIVFAGPRLGQVLNAAPRRGVVLNAAPRLGILAGPHARVGLILNPARRGDLLELTE